MEERIVQQVAERASAIPGVVAVALGGSRAQGTSRSDSDWDFGLYYRGGIDPADVQALGWPGTVSAPGDWGGGVMNGGAWLRVDDQPVDLMYRDLDAVEHWLAEARHGRFEVERLPFYLAGIPTYVVVGELAVGRVLTGELERPEFPAILRERASDFWARTAQLTLDYTDKVYAARGNALGVAGGLARAVIEAAHGRLAHHGVWALNEKLIVEQAGLHGTVARFTRLGDTPRALRDAVADVRDHLARPWRRG